MDIHPIYDYVNKQMVPLTMNELRWFHFQKPLIQKCCWITILMGTVTFVYLIIMALSKNKTGESASHKLDSSSHEIKKEKYFDELSTVLVGNGYYWTWPVSAILVWKWECLFRPDKKGLVCAESTAEPIVFLHCLEHDLVRDNLLMWSASRS